MDTIWTGLVAGTVAAVVALATHVLAQRHQSSLQAQAFEQQTRAALRTTYDKLLTAQRRTREAALALATSSPGKGKSVGRDATARAVAAHTAFIEHYHQLNLDASRPMWLEARGLRHVLDDMLDAAKRGDEKEVQRLSDLSRTARQNLERSFRSRLGHDVLQTRKALPAPYEKT